jgi:hypothetical protein
VRLADDDILLGNAERAKLFRLARDTTDIGSLDLERRPAAACLCL